MPEVMSNHEDGTERISIPIIVPKAAPADGSESGSNKAEAHLEPGYDMDTVDDAVRLLKYAAETGITVDAKVRDSVLQARTAIKKGLTLDQSDKLLDALTKLAAQMNPVTAESLRVAENLRTRNTARALRTYWIVAVVLASFIVPFSLISFVSSGISQTIKADIAIANELVVKLNSQLTLQTGPAASAAPDTSSPDATTGYFVIAKGVSAVDMGTELQSLASTTRAIYIRNRQLAWLLGPAAHAGRGSSDNERENFRKKLEVTLPVPPDQLAQRVQEYLSTYQQVRWYGQNMIDEVSVYYGAIASCILPVLYALLGTCAYLLRSFSQAISKRMFVPSRSDSAHFLIAAIGGAVIGLFNSFNITQSASISPLAVAFLVGYAVDVFFSFLEGMIQAFSRKGGSTPEAKTT